MPVGLVHDPVFQEHDPGSYHCESPRRLLVLEEALAAGITDLGENTLQQAKEHYAALAQKYRKKKVS